MPAHNISSSVTQANSSSKMNLQSASIIAHNPAQKLYFFAIGINFEGYVKCVQLPLYLSALLYISLPLPQKVLPFQSF